MKEKNCFQLYLTKNRFKTMKLKLLIVNLIVSSIIHAQSLTNLDCVLLQKTIESKIFDKQFLPCHLDTIILVDIYSYFNECSIKKICDKNVLLKQISDGKEAYMKELHGVSNASKNHIFIYRIDRKNKLYSLYFKHTYSGASINVHLKYSKKKSRARIISYSYGAF